jgi:type I restriction enzyme S subunit
MGTGTTFKEISKTTAASIALFIAPIAEQQRIVDAIEEHFSRLDAAETTLNATSRKLDAWLTSFLTEACGGAWPRAQLSDIIRSLRNGVFVSRPSVQPPGYPIYRISAVRPMVLQTDDVRFADPIPKNVDAYKVESGDLLFTRYSGNPRYVGAAAVVPPEGAGTLHPDKLIRVVASRDKALPEWIAAYLTVGEGRRGIEQRLKTTAGQVGISGSQLKTVQVAVPPLSYQLEVVAKIGVLQEAQDRVRQRLNGIAAQIQALRRSILAAAFSGRLVPQDPDDEPASVLLERIAASRPRTAPRRRRRA